MTKMQLEHIAKMISTLGLIVCIVSCNNDDDTFPATYVYNSIRIDSVVYLEHNASQSTSIIIDQGGSFADFENWLYDSLTFSEAGLPFDTITWLDFGMVLLKSSQYGYDTTDLLPPTYYVPLEVGTRMGSVHVRVDEAHFSDKVEICFRMFLYTYYEQNNLERGLVGPVECPCFFNELDEVVEAFKNRCSTPDQVIDSIAIAEMDLIYRKLE